MSRYGICRTHSASPAQGARVGSNGQNFHQREPAAARRLIEGTLAGDRRASRALLRQIGPVIERRARAQACAVARAMLTVRHDDLVQEVWSVLWANDARLLRAYDGRRSLATYVGVIARRAARDVVRNATAQKRGGARRHMELLDEGLVGSGATPVEQLEAHELRVRLLTHLEGVLAPRGRRVMRCLYADGHTVNEAAHQLGISRNAAAIWQTRIRKEARAWLGAHAP